MTDIIRQTAVDAKINELTARESVVSDMVAYFDRMRDHTLIRDGIKQRYGIGVKAITDPNDTSVDAPAVETYVRGDFDVQVDAGVVEAIGIGLGNKIINAKASMFTEPGQRFALVHETVEDVEEAEKILAYNRVNGGFTSAVTDADRRAEECGSSALFLSYEDDHLVYQVFDPSLIRVFYADTLMRDGEIRIADQTSIEDASIVILNLGSVDLETYNYLAIMGKSDIHPYGRYVMYRSTNVETKVPEVGSKEVIFEFEVDGGQYANPLTYWASQNPDLDIPEYPIVIYHSGLVTRNEVLPVSYSLYVDCKEFDISSSHLLSTANDAARGTLGIKRNAEGMSKPLPKTLSGTIEIPYGMDIEHIPHGAAESMTAWEQVKDMMIAFAGGYDVPDYMVATEDNMFSESSGIALQVKTRPLIKNRARRIELNRPSVKRQFDIEKAYIQYFNQDDKPGAQQLSECEQTWEPGELRLPENKKEKIDGILALMDKGLFDTIAGLREYHQLPTDQEAIELYDKMKERQNEYPPLVEKEEPKKQIGLLNRQK